MSTNTQLATIDTITERLNALLEGGDKATYNALAPVYENALAVADNPAALAGLVVALDFALTLRAQRDLVASEYQTLAEAARDIWNKGRDHPLLEDAYDQIMEAHNEAFWSSLPYDMADTLGGDWSFMEADNLYTALTLDLEEKEEGSRDYGYTKQALIEFRAKVRQLITDLDKQDYGSDDKDSDDDDE
ncbi:MAG: hypothetical protein SF029_25985 [bacterium]|nr:hypothetical protein [bacterium]